MNSEWHPSGPYEYTDSVQQSATTPPKPGLIRIRKSRVEELVQKGLKYEALEQAAAIKAVDQSDDRGGAGGAHPPNANRIDGCPCLCEGGEGSEEGGVFMVRYTEAYYSVCAAAHSKDTRLRELRCLDNNAVRIPRRCYDAAVARKEAEKRIGRKS